MKHTIKITGVYAIPEYKGNVNVIPKVTWEIEFERNGFTSIAIGETILDIDNITEFTPLEQLTEAQVINWVLTKEGGDAFISMLEEMHGKIIDDKEVATKAVPVNLPFVQASSVSQNIVYNIEQV